jgi:hypothetical protein
MDEKQISKFELDFHQLKVRMKNYKLIPLIISLSIITACSYSNFFNKDFNVDEVKTVSVGSIMISIEEGIINDLNKNVESGIREELVYSGKATNVIHIKYREYNITPEGNFIRDAFGQELVYDLTESKILIFRSIKFEVIEASTNEIKFKVIEFSDKAEPTPEQVDSINNASYDTWKQ